MKFRKMIKVFLCLLGNALFIFGTGNLICISNSYATKDKKEEVQIQSLNVIPRIKITEKNSLKSYMWWEERKPKIPKAFKLILNKIKDDFLQEYFDVEYAFKVLNKDNLQSFNGYYILSGNLIVDSKNKDHHELVDLVVYRIQNSSMDLVMISNVESQDIETNFRTHAQLLREKLMVKEESPKNKFLDTQSESKFYVVFENELGFEELKQIQISVVEQLKLQPQKMQLLYSESNKYTFELKTNLNPFVKLKNMVFINGPYNSEVVDNTIVFKSLMQQESVEEDEFSN